MAKQQNGNDRPAYRIDIIEDRTHRNIHSFRFTKPVLIVTVVTIVVIFTLGIYALIAYTPIRTTVPGYPDGHFRKDAVENAIKIDSLENIITRWEIYAENLRKVLSGEERIDREILRKTDVSSFLLDKSREELARRDSILRNLVREEEQFSLSGEDGRKLPIEGIHFFTPLKGVVSNGFDPAAHPGTDITAPSGTTICSTLDGTVIFCGWDDQVGYTVYIQHQGNIISSYKHCRSILVRTGQKITAGTPVALLGNSGSLTTGDHLHFELWYNGEAVDPASYVSF